MKCKILRARKLTADQLRRELNSTVKMIRHHENLAAAYRASIFEISYFLAVAEKDKEKK